MTSSMSRRHALAGTLLSVPVFASARVGALASNTPAASQLAALERRHPGRICVSMLDLASGRRVDHRAGERILICSTFKMLAAALVLHRVDQGEEKLDRRIKVSQSDLVTYSPVTQKHVAEGGMTVAQLCDAIMTWSDNAAANLLLQSFGGPAAITAFCRTLGDEVTRLDRYETELNTHDHPGDIRDTTTAAAMLENLRKLLFTEVLTSASRAQLAAWLIANRTGDARLRVGLPKTWLAGDRTGTNGDKHGNANDIAVIWPADRAPLIVTAYCEIPGIAGDQRNAVIAEIGRIAVTM